MELRDIVAAPKSNVTIGAWHTGKVPRADFPIGRRAYSLGSAFQWCVVTLRALHLDIRVLVVFNPDKGKYDATLGVMGSDGLRILCCYQYHAGEPGWHCHATCEDVDGVPTGIFRGPWIKRIPLARHGHRRMEFGIASRTDAIRFALDVYRLFEKGPLL